MEIKDLNWVYQLIHKVDGQWGKKTLRETLCVNTHCLQPLLALAKDNKKEKGKICIEHAENHPGKFIQQVHRDYMCLIIVLDAGHTSEDRG